MTEFLRRRQNIILMIGVIIILAQIGMCAGPQRPPVVVSPLDVPPFVSPIYLPLALRNHRLEPDARFGVAEYTPEQAGLLGLGGASFIAGHWRLPLPGDTAVFLHPTERDHWSNFVLCSWSVADDGWYNEAGCRQWVRDNPGMIYVIGNELSSPAWLGGDGDWINTTQYARWYYEARTLIKNEDPAALVAPYGPVGGEGGLLIAVWDSHLEQFGELLQADFYPVHHYCVPADSPAWCWTKLSNWVSWLEVHRGTHWDGPRDYWLTEWGLPAWAEPIPLEASLELMAGMTPKLQGNDIGVSQHAWWPSCNPEWRDACTLLIRGGSPTALGARYLELASR